MAIVQMHICILNSFEADSNLLQEVLEPLQKLVKMLTVFMSQ